MNEPDWVEVEDCLALQEALIARFGGLAGIREASLLDSALNRPRHRFAYGKTDRCKLAACYATAIVRNHPFLDGNKRAGFVTAGLFLESNGMRINAPETEVAVQTRALAASEITEQDYAAWLSGWCTEQEEGQ